MAPTTRPHPQIGQDQPVRWLEADQLDTARMRDLLRASYPRLLAPWPYLAHAALVSGDYTGVLAVQRPHPVYVRATLAGLTVMLAGLPAAWHAGLLPGAIAATAGGLLVGVMAVRAAAGACPLRELAGRALLDGHVDWVITALAVHPDRRGHGDGRRLVAALHDHLHAHGQHAVFAARRGLEAWYLDQGARRAWRHVPRVLLFPDT